MAVCDSHHLLSYIVLLDFEGLLVAGRSTYLGLRGSGVLGTILKNILFWSTCVINRPLFKAFLLDGQYRTSTFLVLISLIDSF